MTHNVCVLMSTYNGEEYIKEQIDSVLNQHNVNVKLIIRDDGSNDRTLDILHTYGDKIFLIEGSNIGATKSFYNLARKAKDMYKNIEFFAFADQDDVWLLDKLSVAIDVLSKFEKNKPNLYFSNLKVVDSNLAYKYMKFSKGYVKNTKQQLLAEVCTWGCTCVFNYKALVEMAKVSDENMFFHDNWITYICTFLGETYYDENSYILYRQHGKNVSGMVKKGKSLLADQLGKLRSIKQKQPFYECLARYMLEQYGNSLNKSDLELLKIVSEYRKNFKYRMLLLFTRRINSGHFRKEVARRIRILNNNL